MKFASHTSKKEFGSYWTQHIFFLRMNFAWKKFLLIKWPSDCCSGEGDFRGWLVGKIWQNSL
jgi:hypothetical protein